MSKTRKILLVTIIATSLLLGLGYAAITNISLNIDGYAYANTSQENFKVKFSEVIGVSDSIFVTARIVDDVNATIDVSGLSQKGQTATATYEVLNESDELSAELTVNTTNSNVEHFAISSKIENKSLKAGESTTVLVTVELLETPIDGDVTANIGAKLTAIPVQPGEEGMYAGTDDFSQTPDIGVKELNEYGFYYDEIYTADMRGSGVIEGIVSVALHKDESMDVYMNGVYYQTSPVQTLEYSDGTIIMDGMPFTISENGESLVFQEDEIILDFQLNENFWDGVELLTKNEYGFYYNQPYSIINDDGDIMSFFLYENGTLVIAYNGEMRIVSEDGNMFMNDSINGIAIVDNGKKILLEQGYMPALDLGYNERFAEVENTFASYGEYNLSENIGDYIDLGNDINATGNTKDDWRIFYADENALYVILDNYLPVESIPSITGINTSAPHSIWSNSSKADLLNGLSNNELWSGFTNGIEGAYAVGTPSAELLINSYNARNNEYLNTNELVTLSYFDHKRDIYIPENESISGYWLQEETENGIKAINTNAEIYEASNTDTNLGIRPVVIIPLDTKYELIGGVWTVIK